MADEVSKGATSASGVAFALISALAFAALVPCSKLLLDGMGPLALATLILLGAGAGTACMLGVRAALRKAPAAERLQSGDAPKLALMIVLNAAAVACIAFGVSHMLATNASVLMAFETAAATICAWVALHRHVCFKAVAAVALICAASVLLFWNVNGSVAFVPESLFLVVACALRGIEGVFKRSLSSKDALQLACVRSLGAGVVLLVVLVVSGGVQGAQPMALVGAVLLGFATFGLGAYAHLSAQQRLGSARAEGYFAYAPFLGLVVSWALFGLKVEPLFFGALALMALGVWLAMNDGVFHEDTFAAITPEEMELYAGQSMFGLKTVSHSRREGF